MKKGIWLDKEFENGPDFVRYEPEASMGESERSEEAPLSLGQRVVGAARDLKAEIGKPV